ncbi:MAG: SDR family oxidoreductase [Spirochaetaceae bacterium]|nr:SDR family oxidoreductase [Myxococcales bacterium]MCB9723018.1 SDR family oxidoreductase [Spirochaetaceae bacterium]HPG24290.1 SDR family oxidoreductase [Myxococcota bacterium]
MQIRLDGKVAIVTGGSKGIGLGIARAFVEAGAQVMITSRKAEACAAAVAELGEGAHFEAGHVGREEDAERVVEATLERLGRIDVLVNNAATNPYAGPTIDVDRPRWDKTFETNLTAPMFWTQRVWRRFMKEHGGAVVNISSVGGLRTNPILGVYDVTKAAMIHLTKQLAAELAPRVRVNCLAPGLIRTDFARALWEGDKGNRVAASLPLRRLGEPEDIAAAALFLAADASSWVTGQTWAIEGGALVDFGRVT